MILLKVYPMILSSPLLESLLSRYLCDSFFFRLCPCFSLVHEACAKVLCFFFNFYLFLIGG